MDAHLTLGGAEPGRATGPLSLDHLAMLRYGHPSTPPTHKMEAVRKANLRYFGSLLMLLARGSSQPNAATSNLPPPSQAPPSSSPRVVTLCHVLGISLLPPPRKNTDNDLENSKHFSALLPSSGGLVTPRASVLDTENTKKLRSRRCRILLVFF